MRENNKYLRRVVEQVAAELEETLANLDAARSQAAEAARWAEHLAVKVEEIREAGRRLLPGGDI